MRLWRILLLLWLISALAVAGGCGRKGNLIPRDETRPADELLPSRWSRHTPEPFGADLGVGDLFEKAGDPERIRGRDLTPEPTPVTVPPDAPQNGEATNDEVTPE